MLQRPGEAHAVWVFWQARSALFTAGTSTCRSRSAAPPRATTRRTSSSTSGCRPRAMGAEGRRVAGCACPRGPFHARSGAWPPDGSSPNRAQARRRPPLVGRPLGCMAAGMWRSGDVVTVRFRSIDGRFHSGRPLRVIEHTPELLVTFMAEERSSPCRCRRRPRSARRPARRALGAPAGLPARRRGRNGADPALPRGRAHSIWVVRDTAHALVGWYVNLEDVHELGEQTITTQRSRARHLGARGDRRAAVEGRGRARGRATRVGRLTPDRQRRSGRRANVSGASVRGRPAGRTGGRRPSGRARTARRLGRSDD